MSTQQIENQRGEVNIQIQNSSKPAYIPGSPFMSESKLKRFLYSVPGYILAYVVVSTLFVLAVYL